jgi:predicted glycogen debranching enzyme
MIPHRTGEQENAAMYDWTHAAAGAIPGDLETQLDREWLAVNGIGGFACSTVPSANTRKYHGLLVAAMAPPVRRMVLLSRVEETVVCDGWSTPLACNEYPGTIYPRGDQSLRAFSSDPFPRWAYQGQGWTVEKTLRLVPGENAVVLGYTLLGGTTASPVELQLRPMFALRNIHELTYQWNGQLTVEEWSPGHLRIPATGRTPEVFFSHDGVFETDDHWYLNTIYRREQERGYAGLEDLWNPGVVHWSLRPGQTVNFVCATDPIDLPRLLATADAKMDARSTAAAQAAGGDDTLRLLLRAADQFVLSVPVRDGPPGTADYVVASYPWSPPSPRQTLTGFCGLFLVPGRFTAGRDLLVRLAGRMEDGVLPAALPEAGGRPQYHGVDASLWFVNAVRNYLRHTGDVDGVRGTLFDAVLSVVHWYREGTSLGIRTDVDGLLSTNQPGVPTTWMDALADGWVVTPRGGKAVEVNALWHNALCSAADLATQLGRPELSAEFARLGSAAQAAFNRRFWNPAANCCYDVIDDLGADPAVRPNQLLAVSLPYPVLTANRFEPVLDAVRTVLMTPFGPRTLAPADANYRGHYAGNVVERDRAYHQGSVHPWLLGHYVTAYLKVNGRGPGARAEARQLLEPCLAYLRSAGEGQLCELFDGDAPHRPGGAIAAATSVAELLRAYAQEVLDRQPNDRATTVRPASVC